MTSVQSLAISTLTWRPLRFRRYSVRLEKKGENLVLSRSRHLVPKELSLQSLQLAEDIDRKVFQKALILMKPSILAHLYRQNAASYGLSKMWLTEMQKKAENQSSLLSRQWDDIQASWRLLLVSKGWLTKDRAMLPESSYLTKTLSLNLRRLCELQKEH